MSHISYQSFCGQTKQSSAALFISGTYILAVLAVLLTTTVKWIRCHDYYPIKERSPMLSLLMSWVLLFFTCLYPWQIIYSYIDQTKVADAYRIGYYTFKYTAYFIYLIRSFRICYAYRVRNRESWVFKRFFSNQRVMVSMVVVLICLKSIPVSVGILDSTFITPIDIYDCSAQSVNKDDIANIYLTKRMIQDWVWTMILLLCVWLQRHIEKDLGVLVQVLWILGTDVFFHLFQGGFAAYSILKAPEHSQNICYLSSATCAWDNTISIFVVSITIQNIIMFIVTIIRPLIKARLQHTMLPNEPNYVPDHHFKIFLMHPTCYVHFRDFLKHYDAISPERGSDVKTYSRILDCWTCIVSMKFSNVDQREFYRFLNNLDAAIIDRHILTSLRDSVEALNNGVSVISDSQTIKKSINSDIDIIENNLLERLWGIYRTKFVKTKCYQKLQKIREDNNRVNTSMTQLNMMLITT